MVILNGRRRLFDNLIYRFYIGRKQERLAQEEPTDFTVVLVLVHSYNLVEANEEYERHLIPCING